MLRAWRRTNSRLGGCLSNAVAGSALGFWAFAKASNRLYRHVVGVMLLIAAVMLWWRV